MIYAPTSRIKKRLLKIGVAPLFIVPIILFCLPILTSGASFPSGDFDMQVQMTEAARASIVHYGQFPFWNPWVSGGVPLFADPQFGLFTPQTLFSFFTSSVLAWKLTFVTYLIVGFFSMKTLLRGVGLKGEMIGTILSYIYVFNSFFILRFNGGHFTFLLLLLLPLAIYLILTFNNRFRLLQLSGLLTFLLYAAVHYSTILILLFIFILTALLLVRPCFKLMRAHGLSKSFFNKLFCTPEFKRLILLIGAVMIALIASGPRLWLTFSYLHDNGPNRANSPENFFGIIDGLKSLFMPFGTYNTPHATYGPFEASNYIGLFTGLVLLSVVVLRLGARVKKSKTKTGQEEHLSHTLLIVFSLICIGAFVVGLGGKTLSLIQHLPVFSSMRVSTRYFAISAFCIIVILGILATGARSSKARLFIIACLLVSLAQVFLSDSKQASIAWQNNSHLDYSSFSKIAPYSSAHPPRSERLNDTDIKAGNYALSSATVNNQVQIITDNALLETRAIGSDLCDEDTPNCSFILSSNAKVKYWSPNHIKILRTHPGEIVLNVNAGAGWRVNQRPLFKDIDVTTNNTRLSVPSTAQGEIDLEYLPF